MSSDKGNIFGEGFPKEIVKQIEYRQKAYGAGVDPTLRLRSPEEIEFLNGNTSWCKIMSSVNIDKLDKVNSDYVKSIVKANGGLANNGLAKEYVLLGGTAQYKGGINTLREGIGPDGAYGIGGGKDTFGYNPMPGIISATINHENRGSLRTAIVKLKAYNKNQFEIIDILYLRLGFHIMLEWGHVLYHDNNGNLITAEQGPTGNSLDWLFLNGAQNYAYVLKKIAEQRLATGGNYDAMLGKVTNIHWSFLRDGSYDITLNISSIGDIIESLKVNILTDSKNTVISKQKESNEKTIKIDDLSSYEVIDKWAVKHTIGSFLYTLKFFLRGNVAPKYKNEPAPVQGAPNLFVKADSNTIEGRYININDVISKGGFTTGQNAINVVNTRRQSSGDESLPGLLPISKNLFKSTYRDAIWMAWDNYKEESEYYVRLGTFLEFLEKVIVIQVKSQKETDGNPSIYFDYNTDENLMYCQYYQTSIDPRICVVERTLKFPFPNKPFKGELNFSFPAEQFIRDDLTIDVGDPLGSYEYGKIMNIYINMVFIIKKLDELEDDQGRVSLIDFLQAILKGVNVAFSGLNNLDAFYDETTNTVKIIDQNPLPKLEHVKSKLKLSNEKALFYLYGYAKVGNETLAGFIKDFSFTTELTPAFSTMISVGAAANGTVVGENETALSKLNKGLIDRYKETATNTSLSNNKPVTNDIDTQIKDLTDTFSQMLEEYYEFLNELSWTNTSFFDNLQELNEEDIDAYKNMLRNIVDMLNQIRKLQEIKKQNQNPSAKGDEAPGTGFIPFNLSLTMDGLTGMKVNQQFYIDTRYLPSNYPDNVRFLIKNLSHTIEKNKWYTKLESYCIASGDDNYQPPKIGTIKGGGSGNSAPNTPTPAPPTPAPIGDFYTITNSNNGPKGPTSNNSNVRTACDLGAHHVTGQYKCDTCDPTKIEIDPANTRVGGWSLMNGQYTYDMVLSRKENGVLTNRPLVPSPVNGIVTVAGLDSFGNSRIFINASDGSGVYKLLHGDNFSVKVGDSVTVGQMIMRQSNVSPPKNQLHLHISFPRNPTSLQVLKNYISSMTGVSGCGSNITLPSPQTPTLTPASASAPAPAPLSSNSCVTTINAAPVDIYSSTNLSGTYLDVTRNLSDVSRRQAITNIGWPIQVEQYNGRYYAKLNKANMHTAVGGTSTTKYAERRPLFFPCQEYMRNNLGNLSFTGKNGKTKTFNNLHVLAIPALRDTLTDIDNQGLLDYLETIYSGVYTRSIRQITQSGSDLLSFHSFGLASDINSNTFPFGSGGLKTWNDYIKRSTNTKEYKLARVVQIFGESGRFYWGKNIPDVHHMVVNPYKG